MLVLSQGSPLSPPKVKSRGLWASKLARTKRLLLRAKVSPTHSYPPLLKVIPQDFSLHLISHSVPMVLHLCCTLESCGEIFKFSMSRLQPDKLYQLLQGWVPDSTGDISGQLWLRTRTWATSSTWWDPDLHQSTHCSPGCTACVSHRLVGVTNYMSHGNNSARTSWFGSISPITHHSSSPVVDSPAIPPRPKVETLEAAPTPASSVLCWLHGFLLTHTRTFPQTCHGSLRSPL